MRSCFQTTWPEQRATRSGTQAAVWEDEPQDRTPVPRDPGDDAGRGEARASQGKLGMVAGEEEAETRPRRNKRATQSAGKWTWRKKHSEKPVTAGLLKDP